MLAFLSKWNGVRRKRNGARTETKHNEANNGMEQKWYINDYPQCTGQRDRAGTRAKAWSDLTWPLTCPSPCHSLRLACC